MKAAILILLPFALLASGCFKHRPAQPPPGMPVMSLVGEGLVVERAELPASFTASEPRTFQSLWTGNGHGLFRDLRARKVGDVVTVIIDINDRAQFVNESDRSREREAEASVDVGVGVDAFGLGVAGAADATLGVGAATKAKGRGSIGRSERLRLLIAAVVTEVLPDGNLVISGSQEVRVNNEMRVLHIAGFVRPLDISANNTVSYERIAEARVSYGGYGKISAVQ
jgi:flagellar L-ring protein precursor FlgH